MMIPLVIEWYHWLSRYQLKTALNKKRSPRDNCRLSDHPTPPQPFGGEGFLGDESDLALAEKNHPYQLHHHPAPTSPTFNSTPHRVIPRPDKRPASNATPPSTEQAKRVRVHSSPPRLDPAEDGDVILTGDDSPRGPNLHQEEEEEDMFLPPSLGHGAPAYHDDLDDLIDEYEDDLKSRPASSSVSVVKVKVQPQRQLTDFTEPEGREYEQPPSEYSNDSAIKTPAKSAKSPLKSLVKSPSKSPHVDTGLQLFLFYILISINRISYHYEIPFNLSFYFYWNITSMHNHYIKCHMYAIS